MKSPSIVILIVLFLYACKENPNVIPQTNKPTVITPLDYAVKYIPNMTGIRKWTRDHYANYTSVTHDTITHGHMLQVTVINDTTISFQDDTLWFVSESITSMGYIVETDTSHLLSFWDKNYQPNHRGIKMLSYYYKEDSIVYQHRWQALGGATSEKYYTE